jgi:hypothetical protein
MLETLKSIMLTKIKIAIKSKATLLLGVKSIAFASYYNLSSSNFFMDCWIIPTNLLLKFLKFKVQLMYLF